MERNIRHFVQIFGFNSDFAAKGIYSDSIVRYSGNTYLVGCSFFCQRSIKKAFELKRAKYTYCSCRCNRVRGSGERYIENELSYHRKFEKQPNLQLC